MITAPTKVYSPEHREKMTLLEAEIKKYEQTELPVNHYYAHGTYTRELSMPEGTVLTGKIHRYSCINIITKGRLRVVTDEVSMDVEAPSTFVSGGGVKKAIYALEDSTMITVHPWDGDENLEEIENYLIAPSYGALEHEGSL